MLTLFALGSIGFWILLALETVVLLTLIEAEKPWSGALSLIVVGLALHFLGGVNVVAFVLTNPALAALLAAGYLATGAAWSVVKWFLFALKRKEEYLEAKERWTPSLEQREAFDRAGQNLVKTGPTKWEDSARRKEFVNRKGGLAPLARDNKERIMLWMVYWPWSAVWTIINDPIKRLFRHIFNMLHDALQSVSNRVFKGVE